MTDTAGRLSADSYDVTLAESYPACLSVARDRAGNVVEIVIKPRGNTGKSGGGIEIIMADLGIALSRILQGRNPNTGKPV